VDQDNQRISQCFGEAWLGEARVKSFVRHRLIVTLGFGQLKGCRTAAGVVALHSPDVEPGSLALLTVSAAPRDPSGCYPTASLHLGEQATPVAGNHGIEVVERRVHVHGAHAVDVSVERGERLDALLEFTGQIQQPTARRDGIMKSSTRQWAC
jgi:hypothetical protein